MSNKRSQFKLNFNTYLSGGRAMGRSSSAVKGGLRSAFSSVNSSTKKNTSSKKSSSSSSSRSTNSYSNNKGSRSYTVSSSNRSSYSTSSRNNSNLGYNLKKYMGQRGGTFGDKSYTKIGDDYYLKANPYSGIDMNKNNKPKLLKENQYNISEENREKINKGRINNYIKGINPYSAPPKNIRDAKAKESVESLMNSIQKKKAEQVKKQNEEYHKGISQAMSNYRPYGVDQRNTGKTQNNLLSSYPSYGSKVTKEDLADYSTALNQFAKNRQTNLANRIAEEKSKQASNATYKRGTSQAMSNFKYYGVDQRNTGKTQNNLLSSYPSYGSRVTKEDLADYSTALNNYAVNRNAKIAKREAEKQKQQAANLANKKITSQVMSNFRPYGVDQRNTGKTQNNLLSSYPSYGSRVTKEDLAEFNTALNNYAVNRNAKIAKREAEKQKQQGNKEQNKKPAYVGEFRQNADSSDKHVKNVENPYPVYGSKMSASDVNALNKKYDGLITATEDEVEKFKKARWQSYKIKGLVDNIKRYDYEVSHNGKSKMDAFSDIFLNKKDNRNTVDSLSDAEKTKIANITTSTYGGVNLENNVKKNGGENLNFENALAISTNPAFKNQDVTKIENMSPNERKIAFIVAREKGQKAADQYMDNLTPQINKREADIIKDLTKDSKGTLYGLAVLNDKNNRIDGFTQALNLNFGNNSYKKETPLNYAIKDIEENGTKSEQAYIDAAKLQNDMLEFLLVGPSKEYFDVVSNVGDGYNQQMYKDEHAGNDKSILKAKYNGIIDAGSNVVLGQGIKKGLDTLDDYIKIPRTGITDEFIQNIGTTVSKNNLENIYKKIEKMIK